MSIRIKLSYYRPEKFRLENIKYMLILYDRRVYTQVINYSSGLPGIKVHVQEFSPTTAWCIMEQIQGEKSEDIALGSSCPMHLPYDNM